MERCVSWENQPKWADLTPQKENQAKKNHVRNSARKTHQKVTPQPKSREVFYRGTSTTTGSNPGKKKKLQSSNGLETQKTPLAIAKDEKKSSPTLKRQGRKHHWGRKAWKPPPPQETNLPSVALSRVSTERNYWMWTCFLGLGFMPNYQHSKGLLFGSRFWPFTIFLFPIK
jgi:hypothetical protein